MYNHQQYFGNVSHSANTESVLSLYWLVDRFKNAVDVPPERRLDNEYVKVKHPYCASTKVWSGGKTSLAESPNDFVRSTTFDGSLLVISHYHSSCIYGFLASSSASIFKGRESYSHPLNT
jgi:hypothetical protein